jgi:hypothetical protein
VDVFLDENKSFDFWFLNKRSEWLASTGLYIEFAPRGVYHSQIDFVIESEDTSAIKVWKYSWNRFFVNLLKSGTVKFSVLEGLGMDRVLLSETKYFKVVEHSVPLLFTNPLLFTLGISEIRYFCNRISERLVSGTRAVLFTHQFLDCLGTTMREESWRYFDMVFSIVTERGLKLFVSPFDPHCIYDRETTVFLRKLLYEFIEHYSKYNIVWDLSSGIPARFMNSVVDGVLNTFKHQSVSWILPDVYKEASFGYHFSPYEIGKTSCEDLEEGKKIFQVHSRDVKFDDLRDLTKEIVLSGCGVEVLVDGSDLRRMPFVLAKAMRLGIPE